MNSPTNHPKCQPIASLRTRKRMYWNEVQSALGPIGFIAVISVAGCIAAIKYIGMPWVNAALMCAAIIAPPIWFMLPDYPTQKDVELDRAWRRAAGLPDDVERD